MIGRSHLVVVAGHPILLSGGGALPALDGAQSLPRVCPVTGGTGQHTQTATVAVAKPQNRQTGGQNAGGLCGTVARG